MRSLDIPVDSAIAVNSRSHQLQNKAEQEQLKRLVLQNERRQGQSEMLGASFPLRAQMYRLTWSPAHQEDARARGIRLRYVQS